MEVPGVDDLAAQARPVDEVLEGSNRGIRHLRSIERKPDARVDAHGALIAVTIGSLSDRRKAATASRGRCSARATYARAESWPG